MYINRTEKETQLFLNFFIAYIPMAFLRYEFKMSPSSSSSYSSSMRSGVTNDCKIDLAEVMRQPFHSSLLKVSPYEYPLNDF